VTRRPAGKRLAVVLAAALLAAGCSAGENAATPAAGVAAAPTAEVAATPSGVAGAGPAAVPATLRFSGKTLDGKAFDATTMAGKPALLWFWAPWCATCASEAMSVADLRTKYGDRLGILCIAGMGDNKAMHEFVSDLEVGNVPHLDDQAGRLWKRFKITQQSTYVLVDRTGKIVTTGYLDDLQLTAEVKTLVA
jgi:thiol-disulfide isomerase/thioredoxin